MSGILIDFIDWLLGSFIHLFSFILAALLIQWVNGVFQGGPAHNYKVQYVKKYKTIQYKKTRKYTCMPLEAKSILKLMWIKFGLDCYNYNKIN